MYAGQEMMYNVYGSPTNGGGHHPAYAGYMNNGGYGGGQAPAGAAMMYDYPNGHGNLYGYHADPSMGATYEYAGGHAGMHNNGNGSGNYRGYGGRGGGPMNRRGGRGGGDAGGPRQAHGFDQSAPVDYEVHDNQLKAPVVVTPATVVPNLGSARLFSKPPKPIVYGSRSVVRICDAFQEGRCVAGERCHDIHVKPEYLAQTRMEMSTWLLDREREFCQTMESDPEKTFRIFVADLKEVVEVPINCLVFTKGLYVDPTARAKRARGAGNHAHAHAVMQVPTSCGLYSTDPQQCKWERWCNQVHIDHRWMQIKKAEFDQWFNELQGRYFSLAPDDTFTVHDPQLKSSISLPKFSIAGFSRGLFQGSMKKLASVCLLFQRGKCTAGSCCNQIHVSPQYLHLAREYAALEATPDAHPEEKQRVVHEMNVLRAPLLAQQQQEQREAEQAAAAEAAARLNAVSLAGEEPQPGSAADEAAAATPVPAGPTEDELGSSGALFEHVQVDEDAEPVSRPASANASLTRRLNASVPEINHLGARHVNSDGSYSFNPYSSVTSLTDGTTSYNRYPGTRSNGLVMEGSGAVQFTPGSVQLHATGSKGGRRLIAVVSPDLGPTATEGPRAGDDMGISGMAGDVAAHERGGPYAATTHRANASYRVATHPLGPEGGYRYDSAGMGEQSSTLHPLDFDASLHFSPAPLLAFDASTTSMNRNSSTRDEDAAMNAHQRLAASSTSYAYPGSSSTSQQQYMQSTPMQRGMPSSTAAAAKARLAASAASSRTFVHRSGNSLPDSTAPNAMAASATSMTAARPITLSEQSAGLR